MSTTDDKPTRGQRVLDAVGWRMPELLAAVVVVAVGLSTWPPLVWGVLLPLAWCVVEPVLQRHATARRRAERQRIAAAATEDTEDAAGDRGSGEVLA